MAPISGHVYRFEGKRRPVWRAKYRLPDGRHRIETMFAFCEDGDELEFAPADEISLEIAGVDPAEIGGDNLVLRAAYALRAASGAQQGADIRLTKRLPIAAGVGGGSADAAAALHRAGNGRHDRP